MSSFRTVTAMAMRLFGSGYASGSGFRHSSTANPITPCIRQNPTHSAARAKLPSIAAFAIVHPPGASARTISAISPAAASKLPQSMSARRNGIAESCLAGSKRRLYSR